MTLSDWLLIAMIVSFVAVAFVKIRKESNPNRTTVQYECSCPPEAGSGEDETLLREIQAASTAGQLRAIAEQWYFSDEECAAFLVQARRFEHELDQNDWATIYESSNEGTELEKYAEEKAGDALLETTS